LEATQKMGAFYHGTNVSAGSTEVKKAPYDRVQSRLYSFVSF
jgi:hypothetical protein